MEVDAESLIHFIVLERQKREYSEVGSVLRNRGFIDACNTILDFVHDNVQGKAE